MSNQEEENIVEINKKSEDNLDFSKILSFSNDKVQNTDSQTFFNENHANNNGKGLEGENCIECELILKSNSRGRFNPHTYGKIYNDNLRIEDCLKVPTSDNINAFDFSTPSPDDLVKEKAFANMQKIMNLSCTFMFIGLLCKIRFGFLLCIAFLNHF